MDLMIEGYLAYCRVEKGLSFHTIEAYHRDLNSLKLYLSEKNIFYSLLTTSSTPRKVPLFYSIIIHKCRFIRIYALI